VRARAVEAGRSALMIGEIVFAAITDAVIGYVFEKKGVITCLKKRKKKKS
jgi:hypothetical protein